MPTTKEMRAIGGVAYGYNHEDGGGEFVFDKANLTKGVSSTFGISAKQIGDNIRIIIVHIVPNQSTQKRLEILVPGTRDHSNFGTLLIGNWGGKTASGIYKNVRLYNDGADDAKMISLLTDQLVDEGGNNIKDENGGFISSLT